MDGAQQFVKNSHFFNNMMNKNKKTIQSAKSNLRPAMVTPKRLTELPGKMPRVNSDLAVYDEAVKLARCWLDPSNSEIVRYTGGESVAYFFHDVSIDIPLSTPDDGYPDPRFTVMMVPSFIRPLWITSPPKVVSNLMWTAQRAFSRSDSNFPVSATVPPGLFEPDAVYTSPYVLNSYQFVLSDSTGDALSIGYWNEQNQHWFNPLTITNFLANDTFGIAWTALSCYGSARTLRAVFAHRNGTTSFVDVPRTSQPSTLFATFFKALVAAEATLLNNAIAANGPVVAVSYQFSGSIGGLERYVHLTEISMIVSLQGTGANSGYLHNQVINRDIQGILPSVERYDVCGMSALVSYRGSSTLDGGSIAAIRQIKGVVPTMPMLDAYNWISTYVNRYEGPCKTGAYAWYMPGDLLDVTPRQVYERRYGPSLWISGNSGTIGGSFRLRARMLVRATTSSQTYQLNYPLACPEAYELAMNYLSRTAGACENPDHMKRVGKVLQHLMTHRSAIASSAKTALSAAKMLAPLFATLL